MLPRNFCAIFLAAMVSVLCYERASRNRYVATLTDAMNIIQQHYVDPVDSRELFEGAIDGMISKLDPYCAYTNPTAYRRFQESLDQRFGGIGILVEVDPETRRLTVMNPLVGTPAHKAGIKPGDVILKIDDHDTEDMSLEDSVTLMRGPEGSPVTLVIQHADDETPITLVLRRAKIPIESVLGDTRDAEGVWDYHLEENRRIGYIRIGNFGEQTTEEFRGALNTFKEPGSEIEALIIDLRNNPGGLLNAARDICDLFLDGGVIVTTRGRGDVVTGQYTATAGVIVDEQIPVVLLVDRFTASASEIVAACLQDHHRASVCGERTWGKGTVQNIAPLEGGRSAIRLTTATYWRPNEQNIHKRRDATDDEEWGVRPDAGLEVALTDEERERVARQRRERDFAALRSAGIRLPPPPLKIEESPDEKPDDQVSPSGEENGSSSPPMPDVTEDPTTSSGDASADEPFDDPQLRRAIEHVKQRMK
jgi:carboxyl-terminal processing protease